MSNKNIVCMVLGAAVLWGSLFGAAAAAEGVKEEPFNMVDGKPVNIYTLTNKNGLMARITNYGGIVVSLMVPDRSGKLGDVVLGYDSLDGYIKNNPYFGCLVGRYGNRIGKARFSLDGKEYTLAANNGENHLHGGLKGYDKVVWDAKTIKTEEGVGLELAYLSPDGEEGYPGNLSIKVHYILTNENALKIDYFAATDKKTVVNLTHHSYFNLAGKGTILDHLLMINADKFTPVDKGLIPTGKLEEVKGTPFDFTEPTAIGARIDQDDEQLRYGLGYDHNWVLNKRRSGIMTLAATLYDQKSGRFMEVLTTEPGLQFYAGNFLDGTISGKGGQVYAYRSGLCLEAQHYPDSPNKAHFPSVVLNPGDEYRQTTLYKFSVK
jgi:aldose 1-epimerase